MKVLILSGKFTEKLVKVVKGKYGNTLDVEGVEYLDQIEGYVNRGGDFDRALIFSKCYTRDGSIDDINEITGSIMKFISDVQNRVYNFELILVPDNLEVGLEFVKSTIGIRNNCTVVYREAGSLSSVALLKLVAEARQNLATSFRILTMDDVKEHTSYDNDMMENGDPFADESELSEIDTISSDHGDGDWGNGDPFGDRGDDWGASGDADWENTGDPFGEESSDGWGNEGAGWEDSGDPFSDKSSYEEKSLSGVDLGEIDDPFNSEYAQNKEKSIEADPFGEESGEGAADPFGEEVDSLESGADPFGDGDSFAEDSNGNTEFADGFEDEAFKELGDDPFGENSLEPVEDDPFGADEAKENIEADSFGADEANADFDADPFGASEPTKEEVSSDSQFNELGGDPFGESEFTGGNNSDFDTDDEFLSENGMSGSIDDFEEDAFTEISGASNKNEIPDFDGFSEDINAESYPDFEDFETKRSETPVNNRASRNSTNDFADPFDEPVQMNSSSSDSSAAELFDDFDDADTSDMDGAEEMVVDAFEYAEEPAPTGKKKGLVGRKQPKKQLPKKAPQKSTGAGSGKMAKLKNRLDVFKRNGCIITVTGGNGAGKTTVAGNIANMLCKMGYSVLVVDMDTEGRGQSSITFDNFSTINSGGLDTSGVRAALASSRDTTGRFINIIRPGFHLLGTGIKVDKAKTDEVIESKNVNRILHSWQNSYNFIIIDIPFDSAIDKFADMVTIANYVVLVEKMSSSGVMNMMIDMMNIQDEDITDTMFEKAKVVFNMEDGCQNLLGKKVNSTSQVLNAIDIRLSELLGHQVPYYFADMQAISCIKYDRQADACWFTNKYYSDLAEGNRVFSELLCSLFEV